MAIFGKNQFQTNKVYYRRKSIRLTNYALTFASAACLGIGLYYVFNRNSSGKEEVD